MLPPNTSLIVIHGAKATGKTLHGQRFAAHYGCSGVVEELQLWRGQDVPAGSLILTHRDPRSLLRRWPDARFVHINEARRAIGLEEAPAKGYLG
jgi:hypothetical protein